MNRSTPSLPALHCLPKFAQIYIHWVGEDIQPFSSSVTPFSSCPQSFPASGSFPTNQLFASGGQSIEASASASVLPMIIQGWFPLEFTGLISLQSKGLSRVISTTTAEKYQFFGAQPSLWSNSHICTWVTGKTIVLTIQTFVSKVTSLLFNMLSKFAPFFPGANGF